MDSPIATNNSSSNPSGVLLLNKPIQMTCQKAIQHIKKSISAKRIGHIGTLDPLAIGLLPVLIGEATRYAFAWERSNKRYLATIQLGATSSTDDIEGVITASDYPHNISEKSIKHALNQQLGEIMQTPPLFSSVRVNGKKLYQYARPIQQKKYTPNPTPSVLSEDQKTLPRPKRLVNIITIELIDWRIDQQQIDISVHCGSGTYIRSIARDVGALLGCGGYITALARTGFGQHLLDKAISLDRWNALVGQQCWSELLLPTECLVDHFPIVQVNNEQYYRLLCGQRLRIIPPHLALETEKFSDAIAQNALPKIMWSTYSQKSTLSPNRTDYHPARLYHHNVFRGLVALEDSNGEKQLHASRMLAQTQPPKRPW